MSTTPEPKPMDFVYAGLRQGAKGHLVMDVRVLEEGKLLPPRYFKADRKARVLGGVYTGALFTDAQAVGLGAARYTGKQWGREHPDEVIAWEALDAKTRQEQRNKSMEDDAKKQGLIDKTMAPLRELYHDMRSRGDVEGLGALECAVLNSLRRRPK